MGVKLIPLIYDMISIMFDNRCNYKEQIAVVCMLRTSQFGENFFFLFFSSFFLRISSFVTIISISFYLKMDLENIDLASAKRVIKDLESQLEQIKELGEEYEIQLEQTIENLKEELINKESQIEGNKKRITALEIQVDDLENEKNVTNNKLQNCTVENDKLMEQNILLEHELSDLKELMHHLEVKKGSSFKKAIRMENESQLNLMKAVDIIEPFQISTSGSGLHIKTLGRDSNNSARIQITNSTVLSTTSRKPSIN
ncbi:Ndl1p NDAI_0G05280 [Naumovozyma dairenensis CBS 421]|uniref:NUDE domain-containing protein n=1 Tax=Naumovozyma dairenensis (strain ATCC 10597 / BCRC 20456 / CBS 421 / NBRC 0211 / NRRL Y-12639) TaxID=1071378 RepID=J7S4K9_NAUDC|nr:hypothetical protein NDAI_0G05280 [Naumovozyma dairenensis CBS 421]CCK73511.1 hypothetical protein NDAI_0G05280 [Naumovozyma dairenensis CBS 421]